MKKQRLLTTVHDYNTCTLFRPILYKLKPFSGNNNDHLNILNDIQVKNSIKGITE